MIPAPTPDTQPKETRKVVRVYVCPTPGCGNYYGSSGMPDLSQEFSGPKVEDKAAYERSHGSQYRCSRAECPDCRLKGNPVQRVPLDVAVMVPTEGPPAPPLPPSTGVLHDIAVREPEG